MTDECMPGTGTGAGTKWTKPPSLPLQNSGCLGTDRKKSPGLKRSGYNFFQWLLGKSNFWGLRKHVTKSSSKGDFGKMRVGLCFGSKVRVAQEL